jgi:hypothetical protein
MKRRRMKQEMTVLTWNPSDECGTVLQKHCLLAYFLLYSTVLAQAILCDEYILVL